MLVVDKRDVCQLSEWRVKVELKLFCFTEILLIIVKIKLTETMRSQHSQECKTNAGTVFVS